MSLSRYGKVGWVEPRNPTFLGYSTQPTNLVTEFIVVDDLL